MEATEYAKIINNIAVFKGLSPKNLERLVGVCTRVKYEEGDHVLEAHKPGEEILIVLTGRLSVIGDSGETLALIDPGHCVGEMAVFTKRNRSANVNSVMSTEVIKLHKDDLFSFVEEEPVAGNIVYRNVIEILSSHMAKNNLLMEFSHMLEG